MRWITRERPKIDRIACPWLIKRLIDSEAEFVYVPFLDVKAKAAELNAIPFDIPDVEFTHYNDKCTFDYFVEKYKINDPAIHYGPFQQGLLTTCATIMSCLKKE